MEENEYIIIETLLVEEITDSDFEKLMYDLSACQVGIIRKSSIKADIYVKKDAYPYLLIMAGEVFGHLFASKNIETKMLFDKKFMEQFYKIENHGNNKSTY